MRELANKTPYLSLPLASALRPPHAWGMSQSATPVPMPQEIPAGFFEDLPAPPPQRIPGIQRGGLPAQHQEFRALALYDAIIDDIFANSGAVNLTATAKRLGKSPATLRMVVGSDMFKARWAQRRDLHNELVQQAIVQKMTSALVVSLDATKEKLEKGRDTIPLPILDSVNKTFLDRLGYNPESRNGVPGVSVTVNTQNNNNPSAQGGSAAANAQASPEGLSRAQAFLKLLESRNANSGFAPGNAQPESGLVSSGAVVEGEAHRVEP